ncbi:MAG: PQQ-dependent sugar dehydrogenase [Phycisphaeraceae bacterium]|nr:PQQ-dependent sugar dehydrogenase [Phycisphaeraceae bacterium]
MADSSLPPGFVAQTVGSGWYGLVGVNFLPDGRSLAWDYLGRVWMINADGSKQVQPVLNLIQEVGAWRDHGMLGMAIDPHFMDNGHIYLLYVVDRHHLLHFGTPEYLPNANHYYSATIGRLTRYTLKKESNFTEADPASRVVLLGESIETGVPIVHQSHGVGTLLFGEDGSLLVSTGDNSSYATTDVGGQVDFGYVEQALKEGILKPFEDVGSFRSQLLDSLCGKVLRLDPATGDGLPSNPFFDPEAPRSARSRVWALGLRNPFRVELLPETGAKTCTCRQGKTCEPGSGQPGTLLIGEVGWTAREEYNLCDAPGLNFGWPLFEGMEWHAGYAKAAIEHPLVPNPDAPRAPGEGPPHFLFRDLLIHDTPEAEPRFINPAALLQAEDGVLVGCAVANAHPGFTGAGYVSMPQLTGGSITWKAEAPEDGLYELHFRAALGGGPPRPLRVEVDGVIVAATVPFEATGSWTHYRWTSITAPLKKGVSHIRVVTTGLAGPSMDALAVVHVGEEIKEIPIGAPTFVHRRPLLDWVHWGGDLTHVAGFDGDRPVGILIGTPASGVVGVPFQGLCAIGASRIPVNGWPSQWHGVHLFGDHTLGWLKGFRLNDDGAVTEVMNFAQNQGEIVFARYNPYNESLYVVSWAQTLKRIRYAGGENLPPIVSAHASPLYGPSPLTVTLDASGSFDPEGGSLLFTWRLKNGTLIATGPVTSYVFEGRGPTRHDLILVVQDDLGAESSKTLSIWTDNTPPKVKITSLSDGDLYPMTGDTKFHLEAKFSDDEHDDLKCAWQTILHHNTHTHPEPPDSECITKTVISPLGCGEETYFFEVTLSVSDPLGLSGHDTVFLYPDCSGVVTCLGELTFDGIVDGADIATLLGMWGVKGEHIAADFNQDGLVDGADLAILLGAWGPCP